MAQTVAANQLTISHKGSVGMEMCSAPDVCKTPAAPSPVPIPYPIISKASDLTGGTTTVSADGGNSIAIMGSKHAMCNGDQAGSLGGVASGVFGQASEWITFSPTVTADGKSVCRLSDKLTMNNKNTVSGVGGHMVTPTPTGNVVEDELCDSFCKARKEWIDSGYQRPNPSSRVEEKVNAKLADSKSTLSQELANRDPPMKGVCERTFFKELKPDEVLNRTEVTGTQMKGSLNRTLDKAAALGVGKKAVPVSDWQQGFRGMNNVLRGESGSKTLGEVRDMVAGGAGCPDRSIRVRPDFAVMDSKGDAKKIYDFKFDNPHSGWKDKWQDNDQYKAYQKTSGKKPVAIDAEKCGCKPTKEDVKKQEAAKKAGKKK
jgi:hypothetical protein